MGHLGSTNEMLLLPHLPGEALKHFNFLFMREQRVHIEIVADNAEEAREKAERRVSLLDLTSRDDESDDEGKLEEDD